MRCPPEPKSALKQSSRDGANSRAAKSMSVGHLAPDRSTTRSSRTARRSRSILFLAIDFSKCSDRHSSQSSAASVAPTTLRVPPRLQRPPDKRGRTESRSRRDGRLRLPAPDVSRQDQTRHGVTGIHKTKTGTENVGNSTSSAPAMSSLKSSDRSDPVHRIMISSVYSNDPRKDSRFFRNSVAQGPRKSHSSAGSSPSVSRSGEPARICSAIRPEFWRIAASILAVMSGLALRKAFEFSRPWPSRWLS